MIHSLSCRFRQPVAFLLSLLTYFQFLLPLYSYAAVEGYREHRYYFDPLAKTYPIHMGNKAVGILPASGQENKGNYTRMATRINPETVNREASPMASQVSSRIAPRIGGPSTPEASSFKKAGADNLVNLFTGDFSYSVPLLDVDGYPVNLFYNGGITMEQEASWVGLGWNINPGSVSRNVRGVPDDFNGSDTLVQTQNVKPNKTWGGEASIDGEVVGIKTPNVNFSLGFSYNNYLGPALDLGAGVSTSIPIFNTAIPEKQAPSDSTQGLGLNLNIAASAKLSSRSGLTLGPSLSANLFTNNRIMDLGVGLNTSYNSRTGIRDLNISSQTSLFRNNRNWTEHKPIGGGGTISIDNSTISFARPSYMPVLRMPMQYSNTSGQIEVGTGMFGLRGAATLQGYYSVSKIADGAQVIYKPLYGYMYLEKAAGHPDAVMDFNRLNDGEVTPHTPVISAPVYDYDIFTVQGEGTGGTIRAYRSDPGTMHDYVTESRDNNFSLGFDIAPPGHYGGNLNTVSSPTRTGNWDDVNNTLNQAQPFHYPQSGNAFENVYFRNPGELTVTNDAMINRIGRDNLVRFLLDGSSVNPRLESQLEQFQKKTGSGISTMPFLPPTGSSVRDKRSQVITMLAASDASVVGLETSIRNYQNNLDGNNNLVYTSIPRVGGYRKDHHISEIDVLAPSGMRYVYGIPVYNCVQKDFTFSVGNVGDQYTNIVQYDSTNETTTGSQHIISNNGIDGYVNIQQTPAYASAFLLTGLVSPDYVDVKGDGITEDDFGTAVKFDYTMSAGVHRWRTPRSLTTPNVAHFNIGLKSERRDNKATISYGEREAWYLHAIESKSMIAFFSTSSRNDAKGVFSPMTGTTNGAENTNLKLDSIMLYTKADIRAHGLGGAIPVKTVHFDYTYVLCPGSPDNANGGKLTLNDIYYTYNGQPRASKNMYVFNYGNTSSFMDNSPYSYSASDRWGTYKPAFDSAHIAVNPNSLSNIDYPYTSQNKPVNDQYAGQWALKKILLPSGGQIEVQYEADDYAYVQNRRACNMFNIAGIGGSSNFAPYNQLYAMNSSTDQNYVYVKLPAPLVNTDPVKIRQEIYYKYLESINQLCFKLSINMPKGPEWLTVYSYFDDYNVCPNSADRSVIYLKLRPVDNKGPLALASIHFLMENLPGQAFPGYDLSGEPALPAFFQLIASELNGLANAFTNAEGQIRNDGRGSGISLANSFVRLDNPNYFKYGGGYRVKRVSLKDNWNAMTSQYNSQYGQDYDYTTTAMVNGASTVISSGVASYEPGIGSEENPFREILQYQDQLPLASAQYGAIEMPVLESLFPAPNVGYSKVTVRSIHRNGTHGDSVVRSAIGKQVTEFFTAKDYPTFWTYTPMSNMDYHHNPAFTFFYKETIDRRTTSQGFLVETNDMHGMIKSQSVYSESDQNTPLSFTVHSYRNTGANGLNDLVDFVHNDQSGTVVSGNIGVDMELMTDVREFMTVTNGLNNQLNVDFFTFVPFPVFGVFYYPLSSYMENKYRAVTTTKLINYHAIEDSVIVNDKGSVVTTKTIAYDAETGKPIVTKTINEFNDPIYNSSIPAYWAYSGMAPAYKNVGMRFSGVNFSDGRIVGGVSDQSVFESGDVLYITSQGSGTPTCVPASGAVAKLWAYDTCKNHTSLTVPAAQKSFVFLDSAGHLFTMAGVGFTILRSGKRNLLELPSGTVTSLLNPIQTVNSSRQLVLNNMNVDSVVAASAVAYKEKWQIDNDQFTKAAIYTCVEIENNNCTDPWIKHINPYMKGLLGDYKPYRSYVYYGSRIETDPTINTRIRRNGILQGYGNYWLFDVNNNLVPDYTNTKWVWNSELTKVNSRGLEAETRDALNIYSAAQYGFSKELPVAVVKNARLGQAFSEGFEDYSYSDSINNDWVNVCAQKYLDLSGMGTILNTDLLSFKAHTGKYALMVNGNTTGTKSFPIRSAVVDSFQFLLKPDGMPVLSNPGVNMGTPTYFVNNSTVTTPPVTFNNTIVLTNGGFTYQVNEVSELTSGSAGGNFPFNYYINVPQSGIYNYTLQDYLVAASNYMYLGGMNVTLTPMNGGAQINLLVTSPDNPDGVATNTVTGSALLCAGDYLVSVVAKNSIDAVSGIRIQRVTSAFSLTFNNPLPSVDYQTYTLSGCNFTDPIAAKDSMINPLFAILPGRKMQISAWVREDCGNAAGTPCYTTNYTHDHMTLQFVGSSTPAHVIHPSGVIIEGWQKIEDTLTIPLDATSVNLQLSSDSAVNCYFDDIRIHPFNADMKSYIYDPRTLRLMSDLDENNYATFYNYDEEGQLIRVKRETIQGIKTVKETRSSKQRTITNVQ